MFRLRRLPEDDTIFTGRTATPSGFVVYLQTALALVAPGRFFTIFCRQDLIKCITA